MNINVNWTFISTNKFKVYIILMCVLHNILCANYRQFYNHFKYKDQIHTTCCIVVDAQCDKLVIELSWQRLTTKVANLQLLHLHLTYHICIWRLHWGWPSLSSAKIFGIRKLESLCYWIITWCCLCGPTFSHFSRVLIITWVCVRNLKRGNTDLWQTDRQTRWQLKPALASVTLVKMCINRACVENSSVFSLIRMH